MKTSPVSVTETILGTPTSRHGDLGSSARFPLFHAPTDSGAGSGGQGGGSGAGSGGGQQGGQQQQGGSSQQQQQGGGGGGSQATRFDPNATYDFGDGKPVKGSDYLAGFMPRKDFESGREFLTGEAKKLEAAWNTLRGLMSKRGQQGQGQGGQQQQQQRPNPMDRFKDLPLVDGATLTEAYQAMLDGDVKPLNQQMGQMMKMLGDQAKIIQQLRQGQGSITEQHAVQEYESTITSSVESLGYDSALLKANPILRDIAEDVYQSHQPDDWRKNPAEFGKVFKARVDGLIAFVRAYDKDRLAKAKDVKRTFQRPGGNTQGGNAPQYQHENGSSLARRFFSQLNDANT